jgi:hypothetical protein
MKVRLSSLPTAKPKLLALKSGHLIKPWFKKGVLVSYDEMNY